MIKLITGKRGTGKTKILIDAIHEAENKSNGNVVAIQKGSSLNTDITPKVRLINIEDYAVEGVDAFYGFVSGILASDYDCTDLFVDATLKITGRDYAKVGELFEKLASNIRNDQYAGVAELADALASGASDRKVMWVQVPSSAPRKARFYRAFFFCSSKNKWADTLALRTIFN